MNYYELTIKATDISLYEMLIAELGELPFDSFSEEDSNLKAYILEGLYREEEVAEILDRYKTEFSFESELNLIPNKNWNAEWEANFQPVIISEKLYIRAPFHKANPLYPLELIIQPKMSFGTGHHETTSAVSELMLGLDFKNKNVLDFGTGTGILAILAEKLGAKSVLAIDNDEQCIINSMENIVENHCSKIELTLASSVEVSESATATFDIIIANITRNIILENLSDIAHSIRINGSLLASGFYLQDLHIITNAASNFGLVLQNHITKNNWCAAIFKKQ